MNKIVKVKVIIIPSNHPVTEGEIEAKVNEFLALGFEIKGNVVFTSGYQDGRYVDKIMITYYDNPAIQAKKKKGLEL